MMQSRAASSLLAQLSRAIGHESAQNELRWMRQTLDTPPAGICPTARSVEEMVSRRIRGEPLQYILGSQPFGPLILAVRPPVLIPRPETEDWALRLADLARDTFCSLTTNRPLSILDLCTGTGCIPMLLLRTLPAGSAHATGIDISEDAVSLARENADLCDISVHADNSPRPSRRLQQPVENTFKPVLADLMHPDFIRQARLTPPYDIITSNPPYIPKVEYDRLPASVKDYEDIRALVGDPAGVALPTLPAADRDKGLTFYHRIAELVRDHDLLAAEGTLALEVGDGQAQDVAAILEGKAAMRRIDVWRDPWEKERVVVAHR